jgi:hypothetical protein
MYKFTTLYLLMVGLVGCSSTIPPEVRLEASKVLSPSCMELLGNVAYQKRSRDILTMNPVFAISRGTDNGKPVITCGASYSTAAISGLNASHALSICEQARENAMVERPKAVMQPCEIYMIGNDIVIGTDRAEAVRSEVSAKGQSTQQK